MKKTCSFFFFLLLAFSSYTQDKYLEKGIEKMNIGAYEDAVKLFTKSISKKDNKEAFNKRAEAYLHLNQREKAIDDYSTSLEIDSKQVNIWISRGKIYLKKGDYNKAESDFSQALILDKKNEEALIERGEVYSKKGDLSLACDDWAYAASLGSKRAQALLKIRCSTPENKSTNYMQNKIRK